MDFPRRASDNVRGVGAAFIAPFWADVDTRDEHGTVFFRGATDEETLKSIRNIVSSSQAGSDLVARFNPKWALVATWEEVGYYNMKGDMVSRRGSMHPLAAIIGHNSVHGVRALLYRPCNCKLDYLLK